MKLSIGNLPQSLNEDQLKALFSAHGTVTSVNIKRDKITKVSLGFGTAEVEDSSAEKAIQALNGKEVEGKKIVVVKHEDLANQSSGTGQQKNLPLNQKSAFGKTVGGGNTGVPRRGGNRGS
ncbi:RNA recognition motif domain-containing protein [Leptospira ilyithenensis]|uniref:RNA-binding protein n=1 Tax=Leptospira ilyithenensis TaxID=2484901 RepID=A0A4R9LRZ0_9LEPT|nr:RNA-binding protein [Leptospira ilyithenensis]TGN13977.1 RNA-binding protein [Leptospira ilyithenensis]